MEPVGRDSDTLDGLNVHGGLVDELHAHPTGDMWDVLETATGARRQPLMAAVTTAGSDRQSICYQFHDYTEKVLASVVTDDAWHGMIYSLDRDGQGQLEDWEDERAWYKANPNLGVSKKLDDLRDKARKAKQMPSRLNVFLQKELNIWTQASTRWIDPDSWRACNLRPIDEADLAKRRCYGGLDLSSTLDVTALVWVFPPTQGTVFDVVCRMWIPEDNWQERVKTDRAPYDVWIKQGIMTTTPGNVVDYDYILEQIEADVARFDVAELAFDPWNATSVTNKVKLAPEKIIEFRQGYVQHEPGDEGYRGGDPAQDAQPCRQSGAGVDGRQPGRDARPGGQHEAGQEQVYRAHRRHGGADHGLLPRVAAWSGGAIGVSDARNQDPIGP